MAERLQKVMAEAGIASRRKSEVLITSGHVKVNGKTVTTLGVKVEPSDHVEVDGVPLNAEKLVYYLFYKPRGVVTTVHDEKDRKTVLDFFEDVPERIYPVGRLDYDTSGLLIMTNDGALANRLTHPKYEVKKTYLAKVEGVPTNADLKQLRLGVEIDGRKTAPAKSNL
ncbi:pseudouridine synthase, partial [Lactiplantibacillus argentoratensis]